MVSLKHTKYLQQKYIFLLVRNWNGLSASIVIKCGLFLGCLNNLCSACSFLRICHFTYFLPVFDLDTWHYLCFVSNFFSEENREFTIKLVSRDANLNKISLITVVFNNFFCFPAALACIPVFICRLVRALL